MAGFLKGYSRQEPGFPVVEKNEHGRLHSSLSDDGIYKGGVMQSGTVFSTPLENPEVRSYLMTRLTQPSCARCGGLMVQETCLDILSEDQDFQFPARHCVQCGEIIDPGILLNRLQSSLPGGMEEPVSSAVRESDAVLGQKEMVC